MEYLRKVCLLGIPLSINNLKDRDYPTLIDECRAKMEGWQGKTLSFPCRVELIRCVMDNTLTYWHQSYKFPASVYWDLWLLNYCGRAGCMHGAGRQYVNPRLKEELALEESQISVKHEVKTNLETLQFKFVVGCMDES